MTQTPPTRAIASLASLYALRMLGLSMVAPVLFLMGEDYQYSNAFLLGIALGAYGLTQALLQIPFGFLSDKFGRKPLIFIGLLLFAAGSLIAAQAQSVQGLIIGRLLQGAGAISGVIMAMVGDLVPEESRTKAMASIGASIGMVFSCALILGPWLASLDILGITGVRLLFLLTTLLALIAMGVLYWSVPNVPSHHRPKTFQGMRKGLPEVLVSYHCLLYFGIFVVHYILMAFFVLAPVTLVSVGVLSQYHAWVYLAVLLLSFACVIPMIIKSERQKKVHAGLSKATPLLLLSFALLSLLGESIAGVGLAFLLFFIAFNYLEASLPSLLSKHLPSLHRGLGSGIFATCQFLGAAIGAVASGGLYGVWGSVGVLLPVAVLLLIWAVCLAACPKVPQPVLVPTGPGDMI